MPGYRDCRFEVTSQSGDSDSEEDHLDSTGSSEVLDNSDKRCVSPPGMYFINSNVTVVDQSSSALEKLTRCPAEAIWSTSEARTRRWKFTDSEEELANEVRYLKQRLVDLTVQKWEDSVKIILLKKENGQLELALSAERLRNQVYENALQPPRWFAGQRFHFIESRNVMRKRKPPRSSTHAHGDTDG